jgi:hypothetical protein
MSIIVNGNDYTAPAISQFTYVVDSDQKLADWANNVSGNDYSSVFIKNGEYTVIDNTANFGKINIEGFANIPAIISLYKSNTSLVVFDTYAKIICIKQYNNNSQEGNVFFAAISESYNIDNSFRINSTIINLNIELINNNTGKSTQGFCVYNINNLSNALVTSKIALAEINSTYCYAYCNNLYNCHAYKDDSTAIGNGNSGGYFMYCNNIVQPLCRHTMKNSVYMNAHFYRSSIISNYYVKSSNNNEIHIFEYCNNLTNCYADNSCNNNCWSYRFCNMLFNCTGKAISGSSYYGYAFDNCKGMWQNKALISTTGQYSNCSVSISGTGPAPADTADGGWNYSET